MRHLIYAAVVAVCVTLACLMFVPYSGSSGDFDWALRTAQALVEGRDPYDFVASAQLIPYPLPVALFGFPLLMLPWSLAAALFVGLSSALLAWGILRSDEPWRLWIFASFPFFTALYFRQWSPLITASWFVPVLAPLLVLVKPQIALPIALNRMSWRGVVLAAGVLLASLVADPGWPLRWLGMIHDYERIVPLLELPFGPLLLLALWRWRDPRARLLLLMAMLPMRGAYDLCPLWLLPHTRRQAAALALLSWLIFPLMVVGANTPMLVVPLVYLPALGMLLWPAVRERWTAGGLRAMVPPTPEWRSSFGQASRRLITFGRQTGAK